MRHRSGSPSFFSHKSQTCKKKIFLDMNNLISFKERVGGLNSQGHALHLYPHHLKMTPCLQNCTYANCCCTLAGTIVRIIEMGFAKSWVVFTLTYTVAVSRWHGGLFTLMIHFLLVILYKNILLLFTPYSPKTNLKIGAVLQRSHTYHPLISWLEWWI